MKAIFLDIDGVLNYTNWYYDDRNPGNLNGEEADIDPKCIERIVRICNETGARIIISSDWKLNFSSTISRLHNAGLPSELVVGQTPVVPYHVSRGEEIDMWLSNHKDCTNYVIIDDREDFTEDQWPHFIHTDHEIGLTDDNADIAIMTLNHH